MTFAHEAVTALPSGANADAAAIRAMCERRFAYVLDTTESAANFVAVDPVSGVLPLYLIQSGILFQYDSTDSTTVADGVTCLVTSEGKRYKTNGITVPYSVLSRSTGAQPGSPTVGDAYIVPTAATGAAWAGQDGKIGLYTARGWQFAVSPIGREIYVRDVDSYYHRNASGVWTAGVGALVLQSNSVTLQNVLGANASFVIKVENQTTNSPPGSPSPPTAYIIGSSPTGSWAGNAGKLAMCLSGSTFTIISPVAGDEVYDKSLNIAYRFNGTAWLSAAGATVGTATVFTPSGTSASRSGGTFYSYSDTSAPSAASPSGCHDGINLSYTAKRAGNAGSGDYNLIFDYQARTQIANTSGVSEPKDVTIALFRDSVATALDWIPLEAYAINSSTVPALIHVRFEVAAVDVLAHNYHISALDVNANVTVQSLTRRRLTVWERA